MSVDDPEQPPNARAQLHGWKEIAACLNRGVRTAQRWERELGLPVHRMRTGAGEVVFANRAEIDAWLLKQSDTSLARDDGSSLARQQGDGLAQDDDGRDATEADGHSSNATGLGSNGRHEAGPYADTSPGEPASRRWRATAAVAGVALLAAMAVAGWSFARRPSSPQPGAPSSAQPGAPALAHPVVLAASPDALIAFDANGRQVWTRTFPAPITEYNPQQPATFRHLWDILDIDGDGSSEAIFARTSPSDPRVYVINIDGSVRFAAPIETPVRFGDDACPPVLLTHVFRDERPDFPGTFLVAGRHPINAPGVLRRLDADGRAAGEYWSNGHIGLVTSVQIGGRWATLVGGANNETGGASLAVFFGNIGGSAPATRAAYACEGCGTGAPDIFLVFPRSRLQQALGQNATINSISIVGPDRISVGVVIAGTPDADRHCCGQSYYTLDRDFRVLDTELGGSYASLQRALEDEHRVPSSTRFREPEDFYPVRLWTGTRFIDLGAPAVRQP